MPIVRMPDGANVQFPDDMPPDQIRALIASKFPQLAQAPTPPVPPVPAPSPQQPSLLGSFASTANHLVTDIPGVGPLLQKGSDFLVGQTVGRMMGQNPDDFIKNAEAARAAIDEANPIARVAGGLAGNIAATAIAGGTNLGAEALGLAAPAGVSGLRALGQQGFNSLASYTGLTATDNMARGQKPLDALSSALLDGPSIGGITIPGSAIAAAIPGLGEGARAFNKAIGRGVDTSSVPTAEALKGQAGALYDSARASGVQAPQSGTIKLSDDMFQIARDEGLVSPTGRIAGSYPRIKDILSTLDDYSHGTMSVPQMQAVRRTMQDAAGSADAGERRLGVEMLKKFDEFASSVAPDLKDASALYRNAKKGELIDTAIELAGNRASQFSGSGFENALRTQFRDLNSQIIKGTLKGVSSDEAAAIAKVAEGGPVSNVARWLGKFAPSGVVSTSLSGGVPFAIGNAFGGPAIGAAAAAGTMGTGLAGRALATNIAARNAALAGALMRNGGRDLPLASTPKINSAQQLAQSLLLGGGTQ